jgi:hypothetical protein
MLTRRKFQYASNDERQPAYLAGKRYYRAVCGRLEAVRKAEEWAEFERAWGPESSTVALWYFASSR